MISYQYLSTIVLLGCLILVSGCHHHAIESKSNTGSLWCDGDVAEFDKILVCGEFSTTWNQAEANCENSLDVAAHIGLTGYVICDVRNDEIDNKMILHFEAGCLKDSVVTFKSNQVTQLLHLDDDQFIGPALDIEGNELKFHFHKKPSPRFNSPSDGFSFVINPIMYSFNQKNGDEVFNGFSFNKSGYIDVIHSRNKDYMVSILPTQIYEKDGFRYHKLIVEKEGSAHATIISIPPPENGFIDYAKVRLITSCDCPDGECNAGQVPCLVAPSLEPE